MVAILLICIIVAAAGFYAAWKPFGGRLGAARLQTAKKSHNYSGNVFINQIATTMNMNLREIASMARDHFRGTQQLRPNAPLQPDQPDIAAFARANGTHMMWLGHSSFLLRMGGKTLLLDPVLSRRASPFQWAGPKRFAGSRPLSFKQLLPVDAVVISHDHYDHLDYATIKHLATSVRQFFVPLGVGAHLERWGVPAGNITELDWWQTAQFEGINLVCTPSRHFSGRRLGDHCKTLWGSWVLMHAGQKLFFSGDTGYGPHFAEIGRRYGPFDMTLMECGQYDTRWANIHMLPEQTVQAARDLGSKLLLPIHWGAFALAFHAWTDSVTRVRSLAAQVNLPVTTPRLGQAVQLGEVVSAAWWESVQGSVPALALKKTTS